MADPLSVLVFGASRGIGRATARRYQELGHQVAGTHRASGAVPEGVLGLEADITDTISIAAALDEAVSKHGPLDVLVVASGVTRDGFLLRMSDDDLRDVIETNLIGPINVVRHAWRNMWKARKGSIVLLSSTGAKVGQSAQSNYTASKAGLEGFVRSASREGAKRGIRINALAPGATDTDMLKAVPEAVLDRMKEGIPMGRIATEDEMASAIVEYAAMTYVTGQTLYVSGGV